jgi:hypothetical protein
MDDLDKSLMDINDRYCRPDAGDLERMTEAEIMAEVQAVLDRRPELDALVTGGAKLNYPDGSEDAALEGRLANIRALLKMGEAPAGEVLTMRERIAKFLETYSPHGAVLREEGNVVRVKFGRSL